MKTIQKIKDDGPVLPYNSSEKQDLVIKVWVGVGGDKKHYVEFQ